jgi:hypothetical protein
MAVRLAAALLLPPAVLAGCSAVESFGSADSRLIVQRSSTLTLAWDPPLTDFSGQPTEVASYELYYRRHGDAAWAFLGESPAAAQPAYTIEHERLGDGLYDFAVQALQAGGGASALHTSLDSFAQPVTGWYVFWQRND